MSLSSRVNAFLEAISFGLFFFAKDVASYWKGKYLSCQPSDLAALILAIGLVALIYDCMKRVLRKPLLERGIGVVALLSGTSLVCYAIRLLSSLCGFQGAWFSWTCVVLYYCLGALGILFFSSFFAKICRKTYLIVSPIALVMLFTLFSVWLEEEQIRRVYSQKPNTESHQSQSPVLFVVFDEWDPNVLFSEGSESLFPNTHYWRKTSFYASRAYPPGIDTAPSVTSMILGRFVDGICYKDGQLQVSSIKGSSPLATDPDLMFHEFSNHNIRIGSVGGMIADYSKVFEKSIHRRSAADAHSFIEYFKEHFYRSYLLWKPEIRRGFCPVVGRVAKFQDENDIAKMVDLIRSKDCDFIFVHLNGGHYPSLEELNSDMFCYRTNLKIVDQTLKEIELLLKEEDLWDATTCILTSDHWWRVPMWLQDGLKLDPEELKLYSHLIDHRVPLFIKMKQQEEGFEYGEEVSTLYLKSLLRDLFESSIHDITGLKTFFDGQRDKRSDQIVKWEGVVH